MRNKSLLTLLFLIIYVLVSGCSCNCSSSSDLQQSEREFQNFPDGSFFEIPNKSNTHILLFEKSAGKSKAVTETRIFLFSQEKDEIVLEDFIPLGNVEWESDTVLKVEKYPGNIQKDDVSVDGYLFDIITETKKSL